MAMDSIFGKMEASIREISNKEFDMAMVFGKIPIRPTKDIIDWIKNKG